MTSSNILLNKPKIETKHVSFEIKNGILIAKYTANTNLTLDVAKEVLKTRIQYQEGTSLLIYIETDGLKDSSKEARDFLAKKGCDNMIAVAILTSSTLERLIGNFYLNFSNPIVLTKLFSSKEDAFKWLRSI